MSGIMEMATVWDTDSLFQTHSFIFNLLYECVSVWLGGGGGGGVATALATGPCKTLYWAQLFESRLAIIQDLKLTQDFISLV